jgi:hypothetical protein
MERDFLELHLDDLVSEDVSVGNGFGGMAVWR